MSVQLKLDGVDALRRALADLPEVMTRQEWTPLLKDAAEALKSDLQAQYPKVTGTLANRVVVEDGRNPLTMKVRSKAPHAHIYEFGTIRRFTREKGAFRGVMPAQPTFIPSAIRIRERMVRAVLETLRTMRIPGFGGSPEVRQS